MGFFSSATDDHRRNQDDEYLYEQVVNELDHGKMRPGVYAKAYAEAEGNDAKAKAKYITFRVADLKIERAAGYEAQAQRAVVQQQEQEQLLAVKRAANSKRAEAESLENNRRNEELHYRQQWLQSPEQVRGTRIGAWFVILLLGLPITYFGFVVHSSDGRLPLLTVGIAILAVGWLMLKDAKKGKSIIEANRTTQRK